jgi:hypothetical protein
MLNQLAQNLGVGSLLRAVARFYGEYEVLDHWKQGEFHHDLLIGLKGNTNSLPGKVLVVATNCNGGVKELLCFGEVPDRWALWHSRCPENPEFSGELPPLLGIERTVHWFDPCRLLEPTARSEYKAEHRERQRGGGWKPKSCGESEE